nr:hypothetical protein [uncultured Sphingomonas sp.]
MSKFLLAAGAAALAFAAPALADKPGHGGQGQQKGDGQHQDKMTKANPGAARAERGDGHGRAPKVEYRSVRIEKSSNANRGHSQKRSTVNDRRGQSDKVRVVATSGGGTIGKINNREDVKRNVSNRVRTAFVPRWDDRGAIRGFAGACPPGLAMKNNGCLPPGQTKKLVGTALPAALAGSMLIGPYSQWYRDDDRYFYRWDDDYVYRVRRDGGLIDALFPAIDRDYYYYPVGYEYPSAYDYYNIPYQYQAFYPNQGDWRYRYGDGAIYRVDPRTNMIAGISSLLAGDLSVGAQLPADYAVYNVPMSYRDRYYDTADNWYRYNDGYIYRVDPTTQLITAVINAIA